MPGSLAPRQTAPRWPHPPFVVLVVLAALLLAVSALEVGLVNLAFTLAGLNPTWALGVLLASLLGSAVNIPVARIRSDAPDVEFEAVRYRGIVYLVPVGRPGHVIVAVNVGGAVIPVIVSAILVARRGLWLDALVGIVVVALATWFSAAPVEGLGIVVPMFVPAMAAATVALLMVHGADVAPLAYAAGTVGTLIGGDLTNARSFRQLGARALSIGGAGTFDGVFVAGVLAVVLAALV